MFIEMFMVSSLTIREGEKNEPAYLGETAEGG
jgi:hypothetical protein